MDDLQLQYSTVTNEHTHENARFRDNLRFGHSGLLCRFARQQCRAGLALALPRAGSHAEFVLPCRWIAPSLLESSDNPVASGGSHFTLGRFSHDIKWPVGWHLLNEKNVTLVIVLEGAGSSAPGGDEAPPSIETN